MYPEDESKSLLLVEDNPADAELTAAILEGADVSFHILIASTLGEAIRRLGEENIDAVVLDPASPGSSIATWDGLDDDARRFERLVRLSSRADVTRVWVDGRAVVTVPPTLRSR